ncbi:MAG: hypothetical protein QNJ97_07210 [Myxococcota bacterium]|nr:hypothetical protein [Myxococcota bacterium]
MRSHLSTNPDRRLEGVGTPGAEFLRPLPLFGLALMLVNDHWLRVQWPCWLTGKLSDVAVVLFFPFLLTATVGLATVMVNRIARPFSQGRIRLEPGLTRPKLAVAIVLTGLALASINLFPICRDSYVALLEWLDIPGLLGQAQYTLDPTDCIALLLLPIPWMYGNRFLDRSH